MTVATEDYALLASDAYNTHSVNERNREVVLGGSHYRVLDELRDPVTGYQGTAYVNVNTGDVVIAHCGTDSKRMGVQDFAVDAGMAAAGVNAQTSGAMAFTEKALELGKKYDELNHKPFNATVTGHSLGGTLAEITAAKYHLRGETFNAFGAAGLMQGIPQGGNQVIDYVRATDVVSAGSKHFGEVRTYATQQDVDALSKAGYTNTPFLNELPSHAPVLGMIQADAHGIGNFITDPKAHTQSILNADNASRYRDNHVMIDAYRNDIQHARSVVALPGEAVTLFAKTSIAVDEKVIRAGQYVGHEAHQAYNAAHKAVSHGIDATERGLHTAGTEIKKEAHQVYDSISGKLVQGAHAVEFGVRETGREASLIGQVMGDQLSKDVQTVGKGIHGATNAVSHGIGAAKDDINNIFDRMYQGIVKHDDKGVSAALQDYQRGPDGQAFLQQAHAGYQAYQQQTAQQAQQAQQEALQQQTAQAPNGMSR